MSRPATSQRTLDDSPQKVESVKALARSNQVGLTAQDIIDNEAKQVGELLEKLHLYERRKAWRESIEKIWAILVALSWTLVVDHWTEGNNIMLRVFSAPFCWGMSWMLAIYFSTRLRQVRFEQFTLLAAEITAFMWRDATRAIFRGLLHVRLHVEAEQQGGHEGSHEGAHEGVLDEASEGALGGHGTAGNHSAAVLLARVLQGSEHSVAHEEAPADPETLSFTKTHLILEYIAGAAALILFSMMLIGVTRRLRLQEVGELNLENAFGARLGHSAVGATLGAAGASDVKRISLNEMQLDATVGSTIGRGATRHVLRRTETMTRTEFRKERVTDAMLDIELDAVCLAIGFSVFMTFNEIFLGPEWRHKIHERSWESCGGLEAYWGVAAGVSFAGGILLLAMEKMGVPESTARFLVTRQAFGFAVGFLYDMAFSLSWIPNFDERIGGEESEVVLGAILYPAFMLVAGAGLVGVMRTRAAAREDQEVRDNNLPSEWRQAERWCPNPKRTRVVLTLGVQLCIALSFEGLFERIFLTLSERYEHELHNPFVMQALAATFLYALASCNSAAECEDREDGDTEVVREDQRHIKESASVPQSTRASAGKARCVELSFRVPDE